jgi:fatty-acyl-CoA synthase
MRLSWWLRDLAELPAFVRMGAALRRASADGRETCGTWVREQAERHPDGVALRFEGEEVRYGDFNAGVNRYAHLLRRAGIQRGDVVGIVMQNSPAFLMAEAAVAKLGAIGALVNHHLRSAALAHALAVSGARLVLADAVSTPNVTAAGPRCPLWGQGEPATLPPGVESLDAGLAAQDTTEPPVADLRGRDVFLYIYTSGTTGYPKPALVRHMRFTMGGVALGGLFGVGADDVIYAPLPLYHGESNFVGFAVALRAGGVFASRRVFSARAFLDDVRRHGATMFVYVGEMCRYLLALPPDARDRDHRLRVAAGAGLRPDIWRRFRERFGIARIFEMYGATEGNVSLINRGDRPGSVGRAYPFQHGALRLARYDVGRGELVRGADGFLVACPDGEAGELLGRVGAGAMPYDGYVDPEATERKLVRNAFRAGDAWFRTGDLLYRDREGWYYFVDRIGDTFRWKGENVSTQEVGEILNGAPGVNETSVYGVTVPHADGRAGMAAVVVRSGAVFDATAFYAHAAANLPRYARPVFVRLVPRIEVTGTLKQRKVTLQAEGFDPARIAEPLYLCDEETRTYVPLTSERYGEIESGERRL